MSLFIYKKWKDLPLIPKGTKNSNSNYCKELVFDCGEERVSRGSLLVNFFSVVLKF